MTASHGEPADPGDALAQMLALADGLVGAIEQARNVILATPESELLAEWNSAAERYVHAEHLCMMFTSLEMQYDPRFSDDERQRCIEEQLADCFVEAGYRRPQRLSPTQPFWSRWDERRRPWWDRVTNLHELEETAVAIVGEFTGRDVEIERRIGDLIEACKHLIRWAPLPRQNHLAMPAAEWPRSLDEGQRQWRTRVSDLHSARHPLVKLLTMYRAKRGQSLRGAIASAPVQVTKTEPQTPLVLFVPLTSWVEIIAALNEPHEGKSPFSNTPAFQRKVRKLNDDHGGPIAFPKKQGTQPQVEKTKLLAWWNRLGEVFEAMKEESECNEASLRATTADTYLHGRGTEVVPGLSGQVKRKRRKQS